MKRKKERKLIRGGRRENKCEGKTERNHRGETEKIRKIFIKTPQQIINKQ